MTEYTDDLMLHSTDKHKTKFYTLKVITLFLMEGVTSLVVVLLLLY